MAFESLIDQLKELGSDLKARVTESEIYNRAREYYSTLPPRQQKIMIYGLGIISLILLINIPLSSYLSSKTELENYTERKMLIRKLQTAKRQKDSIEFEPQKYNTSQLQNELTSKLQSAFFKPEQISVSNGNPEIGFLPKKALSAGFEVSLNKANVRQFAQSIKMLENLDDALIVTNLKTEADSEDPHYHNINIKITNYFLPEDNEDAPAGRQFKGR